MALSTKREAKKAEKHASKAADAASDAVSSTAQNAQKAVEELQKLAAQVGPVVSEGAREARSKASDLYGQYAPEAQARLREQSEKLTQNLGPRAQKLRHDVEDDYLPRAKKTAETTGSVLKAAVDAARKELDKGQGDIRAAIVEPTPQKKKGRAGKVLLILGLAAAGAAAGYIAWQKTRPVEDPWAPPADFARAHYPASAGTESDSSTVSDTVGSADAGDVASALKGEDRSSDVEPKEVKVESDETASTAADEEKRGNHRGDA
ncbi:hypothetical protein [Brachybacterium aquaticum]|uniref:ElaB/YqjD/DUF883 family membrane-anchored ribosome-binding protein n=1 Tax=Brachybacterium aquaticum TaxID=1432564 RepID=A0A841AFQ3_9MICO|nr:hypothetical protein [Brachybacterium aquaticum]MBB5832813.1 ElaB/YqjD/DUF883 family membrane-anchored ribosome-binding protein [Brachybacterium aquaticum]